MDSEILRLYRTLNKAAELELYNFFQKQLTGFDPV